MSKAKVGAASAAVLLLAGGLIAKWEGVSYPAYRDPIGIPTACYGHTGPDVVMGKTYTRAQCEAWLQEDMLEANAIVHRCIRGPIPTGPAAAFTSAAFNIGPRVVCGSTLQAKANAGDWKGACNELRRWNRAGGRVFRGLVMRRADEVRVCLEGL